MSKKNAFTYSPTPSDVDAYLKFKAGTLKAKPYMKNYKALHHIDGLSDNSIIIYEAIRNFMGVYVNQQKLMAAYKNNSRNGVSSRIGVNLTHSSTHYSVIGTTMSITNPMLQEWIGDKSHNTIKTALEQLESMGFIKCSVDHGKKSGRKITLLRDMDDYQPEEIQAIENYIKKIENHEVEISDDGSCFVDNPDPLPLVGLYDELERDDHILTDDLNSDQKVLNSDQKVNDSNQKVGNQKTNKNKTKNKKVVAENMMVENEDDNLNNTPNIPSIRSGSKISDFQPQEDKDTPKNKKSLKSLPDAIEKHSDNKQDDELENFEW